MEASYFIFGNTELPKKLKALDASVKSTKSIPYLQTNLMEKFKDAIEDITQLNPAGVMIFISELYKTTSALLKAPFPEAFDKFPVYGRIKVVQTQIIKCHFYAYNKQNEKLNVALNELYVEYNILLKRMISIAEENKIQLDSLGLDTPTIQDSKTIPTFSKK